MAEVATLPELGELTAKLGDALTQLAEAKALAATREAEAKAAQASFRQLFELVTVLQQEIHDAITVCLRV